MSITAVSEISTWSKIDDPIRFFLNFPWAAETSLGQAYLGLMSKYRRSQYSLVKNNPVYQPLAANIDFSSGRFEWIRSPLVLEDSDIDNPVNMLNAVENYLNLFQGLYNIADLVLNNEAVHSPNGYFIDSHDTEHIRRSQSKLRVLIELIKQHSAITFDLADRLKAELIIVQHDIGLPITGRTVPHELVASLLTYSVLAVHPNARTPELLEIPEVVNTAVLYHVTSRFPFSEIKNQGFNGLHPYAVAVLADETDIGRARTTPECKSLVFNGSQDNWFYLNYFTQYSKWGWDEENNCPQFTLRSYLGQKRAHEEHFQIMNRMIQSGVKEHFISMEDLYLQTLIDLLLVPEKVSLFKSAIKSLFGSNAYTVKIEEFNGQLTREFFIQ